MTLKTAIQLSQGRSFFYRDVATLSHGSIEQGNGRLTALQGQGLIEGSRDGGKDDEAEEPLLITRKCLNTEFRRMEWE